MRIDELPLPEKFIEALVNAGYSEFYPPQAEAMPAVLAGKSVVLAAPTASGKSLVAYIACMQHVIKGGKALYIVPLRALASEKQADLKGFEGLGIKVAYAAGDFDGPDPTLEKYDIVVATSEKADSLMRHKSHWLNEITLVVADEVHLITDPDRGPTLEVTLAKFRKMNKDAQIIALSATIKNSKELAEWLGAEHVYSEWRPVPLKEGIYLDGTISFSDFSSREVAGGARDPVERMVLNVIAEGGQALVFVNTRRSSESLAVKISGALLKVLGDGEKDALTGLAKELTECQDEPTSFGDRLVICAKGGAAFHNAGLTNAQRTWVEKAFKERILKCIIATPTLAAGINLPARRVIVRDVHRYDSNFGNVPIPNMEIKQMCGRAGRPRFDKYGEAVLIAKSDSERERLMERYLLSDAEPVLSKLGAEPALRTHILAAIATGQVTDRESLDDFISGTFFAHQQDKWKIDADIENVLEFLCEEGLVQEREGLRPTQFGKRTSDLYIDPLSAVTLKKAVEEYGKLEGVSTLALLHAVCATPDIQALYLRTGDDWVEEAVGANKGPFLIERENDFFLAEVKTAALIHDWMDECSENHIVNRFGVGPGDIRSKVESAEWIAYSFAELARLFGNAELTERLRILVLRIQNGVKEELAPLVRLRSIGRIRARLLFQAGYKTAADIAQADEKKLSELPGIGPKIAASIKEQAGRQ